MTFSQFSNVSFGLPVPPDTPHAISVSLPTWDGIVIYNSSKTGKKQLPAPVLNGYPRLFIQLNIRKLSSIMEQKYGIDGERCLIFPTYQVAEQCKLFLEARSLGSRIVGILIDPEAKPKSRIIESKEPAFQSELTPASTSIYLVLFPGDTLSTAMEFWQHVGEGISSRFADHCLSMLIEDVSHATGTSPSPANHGVRTERQNGNSLLPDSAVAKRVLRQRIADLLVRYGSDDFQTALSGAKAIDSQMSCSGRKVTENDVFLFPTGMSAIWNAHQLTLAVRPNAKSACFGFVYCDTLKVLEKWGPGCHLFPEGIDSEIDKLEIVLEQEFAQDPTKPPILALYTEFPSNPLLNSPHLPRLRALADKYDFLIIIDDTIGNFVNVEVLPYVDILVTSLSKIFSGTSNVMGGSLVLNPNRRHYAALKAHIDANYRDTYYHEDAIHMEFNSRDFDQRIKIIDENAEALCDFLRPHTIAAGNKKAVIKEVFYPKYITPENYERCRTKGSNNHSSSSPSNRGGGYGGLFSLTFTSGAASVAFYDTLRCFKGPSLGTNFTLGCTYTLLAHHKELDWVAQFGIEEGLVRISTGMENKETLLRTIEDALNAAEAAGATRPGEETNGL